VLFKNIYNFAGKLRELSLMKDQTRFCELQFIEEQLNKISKDINEEETWELLEKAAAQLAYYKTELNMIHPFRGRKWKNNKVGHQGNCQVYGL